MVGMPADRDNTHSNPPPCEHQLFLPFNKRRLILREPITGNTHAKHLLRVIDDHAGDACDTYLKIETLAREMETTTRQVRRASAHLVEIGILIIFPRQKGRNCNTYRLRRAEMRDKAEATIREREEDEKRAKEQAGGGRFVMVQGTNRPPQQDDLSSPCIKPCIKPPKKPCDNVASRKRGGWSGGIAPDEFASFDAAVPRFTEAVANGWLSDHDRLRFLTFWAYIGRQSSIANPGAVLTKYLKAENGWLGTDADEDAARKYLSRDQQNRKPSPLVTAAADALQANEGDGADG